MTEIHRLDAEYSYIKTPISALTQEETKQVQNFIAGQGDCGSGELIGNNLFILLDSKSEIKFVFTWTTSKKYVEIYDVCTDKSSRRRGIATEILAHYAKLFSDAGKKVWLAIVDPNRVKMYTKIGFLDPQISYISPHGTKYPSFFLGFIYKDGASPEEKETARQEAIELFPLISKIKRDDTGFSIEYDVKAFPEKELEKAKTFLSAQKCSDDIMGDKLAIVFDENCETIFTCSWSEGDKYIDIFNMCGRSTSYFKEFLARHSAKKIRAFTTNEIEAGFSIKLGFSAPFISNKKNRFFMCALYGSKTSDVVSKVQNIFPIIYWLNKKGALTEGKASIEVKTYKYIYSDILEAKSEIGGILSASPTNVLSLKPGNIIAGDPETWTVSLPCLSDNLSFHTHPLKGYKHYDLGSGLPSLQDYFGNALCGRKVHIVFSVEGFFVMHVSLVVSALLAYWYNINNSVVQRFKDDFFNLWRSIEQERLAEMMRLVPDYEGDILMVDRDIDNLYTRLEWRARIEKLNERTIERINSLSLSTFDYLYKDIIVGDFDTKRVFFVLYYPHKEIEKYMAKNQPYPFVYYNQG